MDLEFESGEGEKRVHLEFLEELEERNIVKTSDGKVESDELQRLKQFGFGIFLEWIFNHLSEEIINFDYSHHFAPLVNEETLFLLKNNDRTILNGYNNHFVKDLFEGLATVEAPSPAMCSYCPLQISLKVNQHITSKHYDWIEGISYSTPPEPNENFSCERCRKNLEKWVTKEIDEDRRKVGMLGGFGLTIPVKHEIFDFFITNERDIEKIFNNFIAIFSAVITGLKNHHANVGLIKPFESTEIDAIIYDDSKKFLYAIETTRARSDQEGVDTSHLKKKIYNAAVLDGLDIQKYNYIYMTVGNSEKFQEVENVHGSINLCRRLGDDYEINFEIISPSTDIISKDPSEYRPRHFRNSYEQFLDDLEEIINIK